MGQKFFPGGSLWRELFVSQCKSPLLQQFLRNHCLHTYHYSFSSSRKPLIHLPPLCVGHCLASGVCLLSFWCIDKRLLLQEQDHGGHRTLIFVWPLILEVTPVLASSSWKPEPSGSPLYPSTTILAFTTWWGNIKRKGFVRLGCCWRLCQGRMRKGSPQRGRICAEISNKKNSKSSSFSSFLFPCESWIGMGPDPNERWTPLQPQGPGRSQPQIKLTLNANKTSFRV